MFHPALPQSHHADNRSPLSDRLLPSRLTASRCHELLYFAVVAGLGTFMLLGLLCLVGGCGEFKPLSLDWADKKTEPPKPVTASAAPAGKSAPAAEDELASRVRDYANRLNRQAAATQAEQRPVRLPRQPGLLPPSTSATDRAVTRPAAAKAPAATGAAPSTADKPVAATDMNVSRHEPAAATSALKALMDPQPVAVSAEPPGGAQVAMAPGSVLGVLETDRQTNPPAGPPVVTAQPAPMVDRPLLEAIAQAERLAASDPANFRTQLQLRMLYLAAGRVKEASAGWPSGSAAERRALAAWVEAATAINGGDLHSDAAVAAVDRLRQQLAEQAALKIRTIRLASRVDGFGAVTPFDSDNYRPGQWVIIYSEIENLTSRAQNPAGFRSELSLRVELLSADGKSVLVQEDPQVVDQSSSQRRDFFLARRLRLPTDMTPGQYVLRVSVEDKQASKVGESMTTVQVR